MTDKYKCIHNIDISKKCDKCKALIKSAIPQEEVQVASVFMGINLIN